VTAGYFAGKQGGRAGAGVVLAALLGVAGVIIMAWQAVVDWPGQHRWIIANLRARRPGSRCHGPQADRDRAARLYRHNGYRTLLPRGLPGPGISPRYPQQDLFRDWTPTGDDDRPSRTICDQIVTIRADRRIFSYVGCVDHLTSCVQIIQFGRGHLALAGVRARSGAVAACAAMGNRRVCPIWW
jgi:hypothetical protein